MTDEQLDDVIRDLRHAESDLSLARCSIDRALKKASLDDARALHAAGSIAVSLAIMIATIRQQMQTAVLPVDSAAQRRRQANG